jgi:lipopolysaccharide/colanic/teichoic acid biosynthesis glycosyltransferase
MQSQYLRVTETRCIGETSSGIRTRQKVSKIGEKKFHRASKRGFDLSIALLGLFMLLPLIGILCLLIWMADGGKPIFSLSVVR